MSKSNLNAKNAIKNAFSIIAMYISFIASFTNGTFETDIIIFDQLEAYKIKMLPLLIHFWCISDHFCGIYQQVDFYIQNQCQNGDRCIIPFTMSNNGCSESVHMCLLLTDDISRNLVDQKFSYSHLVHCFFYIKLIFFQENKRNLCTFVQ